MADQYHHQNLRTELIETGIQMIQEGGIEKLSLRKLAAACGVSQAAPYNHFGSKEELLEAMQKHVTKQLSARLQRIIEIIPDKENVRVIEEIGKVYVLFFLEHPDYYSFIFSQPCIKVNLTAEQDIEDFPPFRIFKEKAYEVYRKEGMSEEKIKYGIISMWATVHGIVGIASMKNVTKDFKWEEILDKVLG